MIISKEPYRYVIEYVRTQSTFLLWTLCVPQFQFVSPSFKLIVWVIEVNILGIRMMRQTCCLENEHLKLDQFTIYFHVSKEKRFNHKVKHFLLAKYWLKYHDLIKKFLRCILTSKALKSDSPCMLKFMVSDCVSSYLCVSCKALW